MENQQSGISCHDDDVIAFGDDTFKVGKFRQAVQDCFGHDVGYGLMALLKSAGVAIDAKAVSPQGNKEDFAQWFTQGIACELLQTDTPGWKNARVKITVDIEVMPAIAPSPSSDPAPQAFDDFEDLEFERDVTLHSDMWSDG
jgi:hypothetical protein